MSTLCSARNHARVVKISATLMPLPLPRPSKTASSARRTVESSRLLPMPSTSFDLLTKDTSDLQRVLVSSNEKTKNRNKKKQTKKTKPADTKACLQISTVAQNQKT